MSEEERRRREEFWRELEEMQALKLKAYADQLMNCKTFDEYIRRRVEMQPEYERAMYTRAPITKELMTKPVDLADEFIIQRELVKQKFEADAEYQHKVSRCPNFKGDNYGGIFPSPNRYSAVVEAIRREGKLIREVGFIKGILEPKLSFAV